MPSLKYLNREMNSDMYITPVKLYEDIKSPDSRSLTVDCRPASDYQESHVRGAINVTIPASVIMLRRLANGKMSIPSVIRGAENREKFNQQWKTHLIVLYDYDSEVIKLTGPCVLSTLFRRLHQDGCRVVCLQGGFKAFKSLIPDWLESDSTEVRESDLTLENLRITPPGEGDSENEHCDSGLEGERSPGDPPFPVEILPYLFLGNAENSADLNALQRYRIRYILNVTPNLPNLFEDKGLGFKYMKIPIQDHWSQNLATYFPQAVAFIDEARQKKQCILVHCVAGISRSVTITLAYLMQKLRMPLNDAYDFVRQRKANISPNFNFMGQLMDFERQLNLGPFYCVCQASPCHCLTFHFISPTRTTPDSGVDLDRWT